MYFFFVNVKAAPPQGQGERVIVLPENTSMKTLTKTN
jgi:hypothetical protein